MAGAPPPSSPSRECPPSPHEFSTPVKFNEFPENKDYTGVKTSANSSLQVSEEKAKNAHLGKRLHGESTDKSDMIGMQLDFIEKSHSRPLSMKKPKKK
jgi:hypothetical protein